GTAVHAKCRDSCCSTVVINDPLNDLQGSLIVIVSDRANNSYSVGHRYRSGAERSVTRCRTRTAPCAFGVTGNVVLTKRIAAGIDRDHLACVCKRVGPVSGSRAECKSTGTGTDAECRYCRGTSIIVDHSLNYLQRALDIIVRNSTNNRHAVTHGDSTCSDRRIAWGRSGTAPSAFRVPGYITLTKRVAAGV